MLGFEFWHYERAGNSHKSGANLVSDRKGFFSRNPGCALAAVDFYGHYSPRGLRVCTGLLVALCALSRTGAGWCPIGPGSFEVQVCWPLCLVELSRSSSPSMGLHPAFTRHPDLGACTQLPLTWPAAPERPPPSLWLSCFRPQMPGPQTLLHSTSTYTAHMPPGPPLLVVQEAA